MVHSYNGYYAPLSREITEFNPPMDRHAEGDAKHRLPLGARGGQCSTIDRGSPVGRQPTSAESSYVTSCLCPQF